MGEYRSVGVTGTAFFLLVAAFCMPAQSQVYVDKNATGTPTGTSWTTAFRTIQEGVTAAAAGSNVVYVAAGRYTETVDLPGNVGLYGALFVPGLMNGETIIDGEHIRQCMRADGDNAVYGITFVRGAADAGGAIGCESGHLFVWQCAFNYNSATGTGGAIRAGAGLGVFNSTFHGNTAGGFGGAIFCAGEGAIIQQTRFTSNEAGAGGAVACQGAEGDIAMLTNCLFAANHAANGAAFVMGEATEAFIVFCTFANNTGGPVVADAGNPVLGANCIFWNPGVPEFTTDATPADIAYSDVDGGYSGTGNISLDPLFVLQAVSDYRLRKDSPCINSGVESYKLLSPITVDIDMAERNAGGSGYDMGAFEYQQEQAVAFADRNLESAVRSVLGLSANDTLTSADLLALFQLDASGLGIVSLQGIEYCSHLEILALRSNAITEISSLEHLTSLDNLDLRNNQITDVAALVANPGIGKGNFVKLEGNPLSEAAYLEQVPALRERGVNVSCDDSDRDGISDEDERNLWHTNPLDSDTDDDGILDGAEIAVGLNPIDGADAAQDADGDGLTGAQEAAAGTHVKLADTDRDTMPDGYELSHGLDPLRVRDAVEDLDRDGIVNIQEYLRGWDPSDAANPNPAVFVSPEGSDTTGTGAMLAPWATIAHALAHITPAAGNPVAVIALPGLYTEHVTLKPYTRLVGRAGAILRGGVVGATGAFLGDIEMEPDLEGSTLLHLNGVAMTIQRVVFRGAGHGMATAIRADGAAPASALISDCRFVGLERGIEVFGAIPRVRRNVFQGITGAAIYIHPYAGAKAETPDPAALGDAGDLNSGYNFFQEVEGYAVVNERDETVKAQRANWNTDDPAEIAAMVQGSVDTGYALPKSASLMPASVLCTVTGAASQAAITNGSITLAPGAFLPVTANEEGVYVIACVPAGSYTFSAAAPGHKTATLQATLNDGEVTTLVFALAEEDEEEDGGCFGSTTTSVGKSGHHRGDIIILILLLAAMALRRTMPAIHYART